MKTKKNSKRMYNKFEQYREKFYRIPKVFMTNENYKKMSNDAKVAYGILQDRQELSIKNEWYDEDGDIYFIYSNPQLIEILGLSKQTVIKVKKELKKAELLMDVPTGRASLMYLLKPEVNEEDIYKIDKEEKAESIEEFLPENIRSDLEPQAKSKNYTSDDVPNLNDRSIKSEHLKSKNHTSDVPNLDPNDTDLSDLELSGTENSEIDECVCIEEQKIINLIESRNDLKKHTHKLLNILDKKKKDKNFKYDVFEKTLDKIDVDVKGINYLTTSIMNNLKKGYMEDFNNGGKFGGRVEKTPEWLGKEQQEQTDLSQVDMEKKERMEKIQAKYKKTAIS